MAKKNKQNAANKTLTNQIIAIRDYYAGRTQTEAIMKIVPHGKRKGEDYINNIYDTFKITRWNSKSDYELATEAHHREAVLKNSSDTLKNMSPQEQEKFIKQETQQRVDKAWEFYQHRDDIIATGQYEEYRFKDYRDKYVKAMESWKIDKKYVDALKNATVEELKSLFRFPSVDKNDPAKSLLPTLGFYYGEISGPQRAEVEERMQEAFKGANVMPIDVDDNDEVEEYIKVKTYNAVEKSPARSAYRRLSTADRPETDTYEDLFNAMTNSYKQGRLKVHITKTNNIYIPFVGSSRSGTKNAAFMELFNTYAKGKGINFGQ